MVVRTKWGACCWIFLPVSFSPLVFSAGAPICTTTASTTTQSLDWDLAPLLISAMVLLIATERIISALNAIPQSNREDLDLPTSLDLQGPIAHDQLLRLSKHLQNNTEYNPSECGVSKNDPTILSALLRGTKVYVPPPPKKPEPVRVHSIRTYKPSHSD